MVRDQRGNFVESQGVATEPRELRIADARQLAPAAHMALEKRFRTGRCPSCKLRLLDHERITGHYYRDCEDLVAAQTGGRVWAFDHNIRSASGQAEKRQEKGGQDVQAPAHIVHGDYTLRSAPERLLQLTQAPNVNDTLKADPRASKA